MQTIDGYEIPESYKLPKRISLVDVSLIKDGDSLRMVWASPYGLIDISNMQYRPKTSFWKRIAKWVNTKNG